MYFFVQIKPNMLVNENMISFFASSWHNKQLFCMCPLQEISAIVFNLIGFQDGITIKLYHGLRFWEIKIKVRCFQEGWETYCAENLIDEANMIFLRIKGNLSYDSMAFCTLQSHSYAMDASFAYVAKH